ncbi:hypothetical protein ACOSQ2_027872 [Xanthoceras sorbifolium]
MGINEGNNSGIEETKVFMDELATSLSDGSRVVVNLSADMEGLEKAEYDGPTVQNGCRNGQAQVKVADLILSSSNESVFTPIKPTTRKWKRAARKGLSQSALEGIPSPIQRILSARRNSKIKGRQGSHSPLNRSPVCKVNLQFSPSISIDTG